jgi:hypothetical protein
VLTLEALGVQISFLHAFLNQIANMASASVKQSCAKCDQGFRRNMCSGCQKWFCNKHYNEHQEELAREMNDVTKKHDELHSHLTIDNMDREHPLLVRINNWEQRSIDRIRAVTNEARTKLKQSLDQLKQEIKTSMNQVADHLKTSRENQHYTEIGVAVIIDQ